MEKPTKAFWKKRYIEEPWKDIAVPPAMKTDPENALDHFSRRRTDFSEYDLETSRIRFLLTYKEDLNFSEDERTGLTSDAKGEPLTLVKVQLLSPEDEVLENGYLSENQIFWDPPCFTSITRDTADEPTLDYPEFWLYSPAKSAIDDFIRSFECTVLREHEPDPVEYEPLTRLTQEHLRGMEERNISLSRIARDSRTLRRGVDSETNQSQYDIVE